MINKSLFLTAVALAPSLSAVPVNTTTNTIEQPEVLEDEIQEEQNESCTVMYVGKDVSTTGRAYCCRCGDTSPKGININATIFEHNQLANVTTKGKNGFSWKFPSTTYRYISTPRNVLVRNGLHWEVSTINEMGVCSSATLSCATHDLALEADPFVATGISEDNLAQIMGATGTSAKQAMQTIAKIVDEQGSAEPNIIMAIDKNETWLMEMYTGHQYCAIKMPDDKACTIGNEFFLDTLNDLGISEENKENCILSKDLLNLPKTAKTPFVKYDSSGKQDIYHLDLFNTYAGQKGEGGQGVFVDGCHMRTWMGRKLFTKKPAKYEPQTKYPAFFVPDKMPGNKLSVENIITYYRDRFESILNNQQDQDYPYFDSQRGKLRPVGVAATYQVHIMSVNPDLPTEISAEETIALSSANYTPFIPLNAGVTRMSNYYTHVSKNFGYDENSAYCVFKRLNGLADTDRDNYGIPIEHFMAENEGVWQEHYEQLKQQIKDKPVSLQNNVLTNYCTALQDGTIDITKQLFNDLLWHIITQPAVSERLFQPFGNLQYYAYLYGWDYKKENDLVTLKSGNDVVTVDYNYTEKPAQGWVVGKISKNGSEPEAVRVTVKDDAPCVNYDVANQYLAEGRELVPIKWQDYYTTKDHTALIVSLSVIATVGAAVGMAVPIAMPYIKRKKTLAQH